MSTVLRPKGSRVYGPKATAGAWAKGYLGSTVGQKMIVAVTGLSLATFLVGHMVGNAKMFSGQDSINAYARFLKHDLGVLIWVARAGLLGGFLLHLFINIRLKLRSAAARPVRYAVNTRVAQASIASRTMLLTGLVIAAFTVFHLAHFTFGAVHEAVLADGTAVHYKDLTDAKGRHDVYSMVVAGFRTPWISILYIVTQLVLFVHLSHGLQSSMQTLAVVGRRFTPVAQYAGHAVAATIVAGNLAIVAAVWTGYVPPVEPTPAQPAAVQGSTGGVTPVKGGPLATPAPSK